MTWLPVRAVFSRLIVLAAVWGSRVWAQEAADLGDYEAGETPMNPGWDAEFWAPAGPASVDVRAGYGWGERLAQPLFGGVRHAYLLLELRLPSDLLAAPATRRLDPPLGVPERLNRAVGMPSSPRAVPVAGWGEYEEDDVAPDAPRSRVSEAPRRAVRSDEDVDVASGAEDRAPHPRDLVRSPEAQQPPAPQPLPIALVREALTRDAALARIDAALLRLHRLSQKSRTSGLLPELRLRGVHGFDQTSSYDSGSLLPQDPTTRAGVDSLLEMRLTFHLERLVYSGDEPGLERVRLQLQRERQEHCDQLMELLLDWWDVLAEQGRPDLQDDEVRQLERRRLRLEGELVVRTGGWLPRHGPPDRAAR